MKLASGYIWNTAWYLDSIFTAKRKRCIFKNMRRIYIYVDRFISQDGAPRLSNLRVGGIVGGIFQLMFVQRSIFNMEILRYFAE